MSLSSFRGASELGCSRVRTHSAKSATADLDGSEPANHNHRHRGSAQTLGKSATLRISIPGSSLTLGPGMTLSVAML